MGQYDVAKSGDIVAALIKLGYLPADGPPTTAAHDALLDEIGATFVDDVIVFQGAIQWSMDDGAVTEPPIDHKYIVFKRKEFMDWWECSSVGGSEHLSHGRVVQSPDSLPDAVVIRRQDLFSPPALDAYCNGIQIAVEALKADSAGYNSKLVERLEGLARYFHAQATAAWETERKMPD